MEVLRTGSELPVHRHDASGGDIIVIEPRGSTTRLTFDASHHNSSPVWSPTEIVSLLRAGEGKWGYTKRFRADRGQRSCYTIGGAKAPMSWSPDGKRIVFWIEDPKNGAIFGF